jgi:hypothetical protein
MEKGRYDNVPLSAKTRKGMVLTIDDLAAIGRLLSLQDLVYEDEFLKLHVRLSAIELSLININKILDDHERRLICIERKLQKHIEESGNKIA